MDNANFKGKLFNLEVKRFIEMPQRVSIGFRYRWIRSWRAGTHEMYGISEDFIASCVVNPVAAAANG
jgi:hypothetical protein